MNQLVLRPHDTTYLVLLVLCTIIYNVRCNIFTLFFIILSYGAAKPVAGEKRWRVETSSSFRSASVGEMGDATPWRRAKGETGADILSPVQSVKLKARGKYRDICSGRCNFSCLPECREQVPNCRSETIGNFLTPSVQSSGARV